MYTKLYYIMHTNCLLYQKTINSIGNLPGLLEQNILDLGRILVYLHLYHTLILRKMDGVIIILRERLVNWKNISELLTTKVNHRVPSLLTLMNINSEVFLYDSSIMPTLY